MNFSVVLVLFPKVLPGSPVFFPPKKKCSNFQSVFCEQWKKTHLLLPEMTQLEFIFLSNLITAICKGFYFANFQQIKKPRASSYIRLVLLPSGQTVYKVDALSQNVTIGSNSTTLRFLIPLPVLSMEGLYAILMDKGVVVGEGCSSGGTFTPGISSSSAWRFYVRGVCRFGYSLSLPDFRSCVGELMALSHFLHKFFNMTYVYPTLLSSCKCFNTLILMLLAQNPS